MKKRCISLLLSLLLVISVVTPAMAVVLTDISTHWAKADIEYLVSKGVIGGYTDDTYRPENNITKAEFIKIVNRSFGFTSRSNINYPDVASSKWYYDEIRIADAAGYMFTFNGKVRPDDYLTRQEAAAMFGRVLGLPTSSDTYFTDKNKISSWALPYIGAVADEGIFGGYGDGSFRPTNNITRAEVARVFNNVIGNLYNTAGTYSNSVSKNVTITTSGVTLRNMSIPGNLYITQGASGGRIALENVYIGGSIISIGSPSVTVELNGSMTTVNAETKGIAYNVQGSVAALNIDSSYSGANVTVGANGQIDKLTLNATGTVSGTGKIKEAVLNMSGVNMTLVPQKWILGTGVTATIGGSLKTSSGSDSGSFIEGYPKAAMTSVSDLGAAMIKVDLKLEETGSVYVMAVPRGSLAPTAQQVVAMQNYGYVTVSKCAKIDVIDKTKEYSVELTDLMSSVPYDVYVTANSSSNYYEYCDPIKLQPNMSIFMTDYPAVYNTLTNSATIQIKLTRQAAVFWAAVAKNATAPTADQIINQTAATGTLYGNKMVYANTIDYIAISGLVNGTDKYDVYLVTKDMMNTVEPTAPLKMDISQAVNSVEASYDSVPVNGDYSTTTSIKLSFSKDMMCSSTRTPISFLENKLGDYIKVTAANAATGEKIDVTGYSLKATSNKTIAITPPTGGWPYATNFTIEMTGLINESGIVPSPQKFTFSTSGTHGIISAPVASKTNASVYTGEVITLTCATPGATIIYSTDGYNPLASANQKQGSGERTEVTVDASYLQGWFILKAVAKVGNTYSQEFECRYAIEKSTPLPTLLNYQGQELSTQTTVNSGDILTVHCAEEGAEIYYTTDGSLPSINSPKKQSGDSLLISDINKTGKLTIRLMAIKKGSDGKYEASTDKTYNLTVVNTGTSITQKPSIPTVTINGQTCTSTTGYITLSPSDTSINITATSMNHSAYTRYYYTFNGQTPYKDDAHTFMMSTMNSQTIQTVIDRYGSNASKTEGGVTYRLLTLKVVAFNDLYIVANNQSQYSDVVTVNIWVPYSYSGGSGSGSGSGSGGGIVQA